jgi:hypothetical protein
VGLAWIRRGRSDLGRTALTIGARGRGVGGRGTRATYDGCMMEVLTRYARNGDLQIAYQVAGEGPLDVLVVPSWFSNIELDWELPRSARFLTRLASFARLIQFDRRGAGMSGGIAWRYSLRRRIRISFAHWC